MATDKTLYDVLGVHRTAPTDRIRDAYRALAREHHPDLSRADADSRAMADINKAWSVLSDPVRRMEYDRSLSPTGERVGRPAGASGSSGHDRPATVLPPARVPWRLLAVLGVCGAVFVVVVDAMSSPATPSKPDQLLQSGSCVVIDDRSEAVEVSCADAHDGVVRQLIAFDRTCPFDTQAHRDRQGMGLACVDMAPFVPTDGSVQDGGASG